MLSTCSRPPGELLKMRTLPDSTTNRPAHGSPSLNTISPAEYFREETRSIRNSNSPSERPENRGVLRRALARLCSFSGTAGIVQKRYEIPRFLGVVEERPPILDLGVNVGSRPPGLRGSSRRADPTQTASATTPPCRPIRSVLRG